MAKTEKIVIKFRDGKISCKGNASNHHTWLACQKLNLNEVESTRPMRVKAFVKKFVRCVKFALSSKDENLKIVAR